MIGQHSKIGLVLGGGGVLGGAWEIGAFHALKQETGWDPSRADLFVGTSAGSLLAALLAAQVPPGIDLIDASARRRQAFPWPVPGSIALGISGMRTHGARRWIMTIAGLIPRGALSSQPIQEGLRRRVPGGWPAGRRLWITATDYDTGNRVVFGRRDAPPARLPEAVAASCAIPGIYSPVEIGGRSYIDGGIYSPANLDLLIDAGIQLAICLSPMSSSRAAARGIANRLQGLAEHAAHRQLLLEACALRGAGIEVILLEPNGEDLAAMGLNLMNRKRAQPVFEMAARTVTEQLRGGRAAGLMKAALRAPSSSSLSS